MGESVVLAPNEPSPGKTTDDLARLVGAATVDDHHVDRERARMRVERRETPRQPSRAVCRHHDDREDVVALVPSGVHPLFIATWRRAVAAGGRPQSSHEYA
jgi:hypothetical protein